MSNNTVSSYTSPPPRPRFRVRKQSYSKRRMLSRWDMMLYIQSSFYLTSSPDSISTYRAALFFMTLCSWLSVLRRNARLKGSVRVNSQRALWQLPHCTGGGSRWCPWELDTSRPSCQENSARCSSIPAVSLISCPPIGGPLFLFAYGNTSTRRCHLWVRLGGKFSFHLEEAFGRTAWRGPCGCQSTFYSSPPPAPRNRLFPFLHFPAKW